MRGCVAQWLEQGTHNPLVAGSNPATPTKGVVMTKQDADVLAFQGALAAANLVSSGNALYYNSAILSMIFEGMCIRGASYHDWEVKNKTTEIHRNLAGIRRALEQWEEILSKLEGSITDITD